MCLILVFVSVIIIEVLLFWKGSLLIFFLILSESERLIFLGGWLI